MRSRAPKIVKRPPLPLDEAMRNEYVNELSAPAFGTYVRLLAAALRRQADVLNLSDLAVVSLARTHIASWKHTKKDVYKALADTLDELQAIYRESEAKLAARQQKAAYVRSFKKKLINRAKEFVAETLQVQGVVLEQGYYPPINSRKSPKPPAAGMLTEKK